MKDARLPRRGAACVASLLAAAAWGCGGAPEGGGDSAVAPLEGIERARALARSTIIVDTHVDVPYRLTRDPVDVGQRVDGGDFDHPRAVEGGLDVPFMSIYVPAEYQESGGARRFADELIDRVQGIAADHPDKFRMVTSVEQARAVDERVGLALGMENGAPVEGDLANLAHFHGRGIRYITLTHSKNNGICDSSYDDEETWGGLSPFGREVVAEMNRLGIMIDVSHVSDATFAQVIQLTSAPVIASHSSCRHFTPGWERNMSDAMIRELAAGGGVIQINFGSAFLNDEYRRTSRALREDINAYLDEHEIDRDSEPARAYAKQYRSERPIEVADIGEVADHIDHVVQLVGVDHVGLGSDFDGVGDSLPRGLEDVSKFPNLIAVLLERGYGEAEIEKICSGNVLRVWAEVERIAAEQQAGG